MLYLYSCLYVSVTWLLGWVKTSRGVWGVAAPQENNQHQLQSSIPENLQAPCLPLQPEPDAQRAPRDAARAHPYMLELEAVIGAAVVTHVHPRAPNHIHSLPGESPNSSPASTAVPDSPEILNLTCNRLHNPWRKHPCLPELESVIGAMPIPGSTSHPHRAGREASQAANFQAQQKQSAGGAACHGTVHSTWHCACRVVACVMARNAM